MRAYEIEAAGRVLYGDKWNDHYQQINHALQAAETIALDEAKMKYGTPDLKPGRYCKCCGQHLGGAS
jgi:hypothetical protein